ncbi:sel1 repeat family protein [Pelomyxa schiedti]|nr:sel1 repeat family protein [Pelomyxa schiedti]
MSNDDGGSMQVHRSAAACQQKRCKLVMEAISRMEVGDAAGAIRLVSDACTLFDTCHIIDGETSGLEEGEEELCYLPGLILIHGLCILTNDQVSLFPHIPPNLSIFFSRAISASTAEMRYYCHGVLLSANKSLVLCAEAEETTTRIAEEWNSLVTAAESFACNNVDSTTPIQREDEDHDDTNNQRGSWAHKLFVALWTTFCLENTSCEPLWLELSKHHHIGDDSSSSSSAQQLLPSLSLTLLGMCHFYGIAGFKKDVNCAVSLWRRAVDSGNAMAMNSIAVCYNYGWGVSKCINQSVSLYRKAADCGNAKALFNLGFCFENGEASARDMKQAVSLYQRAVAVGSTSAMFNLADCYLKGDGVDKDVNMGLSLIRRAANAGDSAALADLGVRYKFGHGVDKDIKTALLLCRKAANVGSSKAMNNLALCYEEGVGVTQDPRTAMSLFRKASDAGNSTATCNLGLRYELGKGVEKDINRAVSLYMKAADAGNSGGMYHLGKCFENGQGVQRDTRLAVSHYKRAANMGYQKAIRHVAALLERYNP